MPDFLDAYGAAITHKPAVIWGDTEFSFSDIAAISNRFARALTALGLERGDRAVWVSPNNPNVICWGHACRKLGIVSVPLNYRFTDAESKFIIDNSDAKLVFAHPDWGAQMRSVTDVKVVTHDELHELGSNESPDPLDETNDGLGSSMIYTSGTTGKPKGAMRSGTDPAVVASLVGELGLGTDDVHLTTGPLYHSGPSAFAGISSILGCTIVVLEKFDPEQWLELVDKHKVSTTFTAPTPLKRIVSLPADIRAKYDTSSLRVVIANAAPVPYSLKQEWVEAFGDDHLFEVYGSTELGVDTILRPEDQLRKPGSCGRPVATVEARILDDEGNVLGPNEEGTLWLKSGSAFDGYHKAPEKTAEAQLEHDPEWRTVGDIAYIDDEGFIHICDRRNDLIISAGVNIYPAEIEDVLHGHPAVMDCGVIGVPDDEWGHRVHAVVQLKPGMAATADDLAGHCRDNLAGFKVPRSWEFRDQMPRTDSGKLLKRVLRES